MTDGAPKKRQGFAALTPERQREIAAMGGRKAQAGGKAHRYNPDSAREAGKKGGKVTSADREHMAEIGRKGGTNKGGKLHKHPRRMDDDE